MSGQRNRWLGLGLLASAGAGLLALTSIMSSAFAFGDDTALIMGPSGFPIPAPPYLDAVEQLYLDQILGSGSYTPTPLYTPEGLYPVTGVRTLPIDPSAAEGATILNNAIDNDAANGVAVFGFSQSSVVSTLEMEQLAAAGNPIDPADLSFILVGDVNNPDGGLLERFDGLTIASLGTTFSGATPADTPYPTDIYTIEYDGFADYPKYPIDLLADINAYIGILYAHADYVDLQPDEITNAIQLPVTSDYYADGGVTDYFMIPIDQTPFDGLPLLEPLRLVPFIGTPLADLLQPDLTLLVNLGYGNLDSSFMGGWDQGPANVPTPAGLFPNINFGDLFTDLINGAGQGITAFINDLEHPTILDTAQLQQFFDITETFGLTPTNSPTLLQLIDALSTYGNADVPITPSTDLVTALSDAGSALYSILQPTADIINSFFTTVPGYDIQLFTDDLEAGNLLGAIGDPLAFDFSFIPLAIGFEGAVVLEGGATAFTDVSGLF